MAPLDRIGLKRFFAVLKLLCTKSLEKMETKSLQQVMNSSDTGLES